MAERLDEVLAECGAEELEATADEVRGVRVERDCWLDLARRLRADDVSFEMLLDLTAVDWWERDPRYDIVVHLWSLRFNRLLRVKVGVAEEDPVCPSVVTVWPTADWHEREVFDLFGLRFDGHPDLRRILMPEDYAHHPLRKDFPLQGIDNAACYLREGGVLMTEELEVDRPPGQDRTPVDRSRGDPAGYRDGAEEV